MTMEETGEVGSAELEWIPGAPGPLNKALYDSFQYALGLKGGMAILFEDLSWDPRSPDWICLKSPSCFDSMKELLRSGVGSFGGSRRGALERGLCVRISEIIWCCDAPFGS